MIPKIMKTAQKRAYKVENGVKNAKTVVKRIQGWKKNENNESGQTRGHNLENDR